MAGRPLWRGSLRLALVSCPVALHVAQREAGNLHFHLINPATGHRIQMVTQDAETHEPVERADLVRGYEATKDHYLLLENSDFEAARIASSSVMTIDKFIDAASIDPIHFEASYYLAPDGPAQSDVYAVLHEAIRASGRAALSRVVLSRREKAVAILPLGRGLVAHMLREPRDIVDPAEIFSAIPTAKPDREMLRLAGQLIARQAGTLEPADLEDRYETRLRAVIEARLQGEGAAPDAADPAPDNVIDLLAALRQSLSEDKKPARKRRAGGKRKP